MKLEDLRGKTFGKLFVLERVANFEGSSDTRARWLVLCDCGQKEQVIARYLKRGDKKACAKCTPTGKHSTPLADALQENESLKKLLDLAISELQEERDCVDYYFKNAPDPTRVKLRKSSRIRIDYE